MRILVVEDEPRLLRNLAKALREEGYAVDAAESGDDGGSDVGGTSDAFHFIHQPVVGDFDMAVKVTRLVATTGLLFSSSLLTTCERLLMLDPL